MTTNGFTEPGPVGASVSRYSVEELCYDNVWRIDSTHRTPAEAETEYARRLGAPAYQKEPWRLRTGGIVELRLNPRLAANIEKADAAIVDFIPHDHRGRWFTMTCVGTIADLTLLGLAHDYMFENLGSTRTRSSTDEFGSHYHLTPRGKDRFKVAWYINEEPKTPHGRRRMAAPRTPDDVDVVPLLERFRRTGASAID